KSFKGEYKGNAAQGLEDEGDFANAEPLGYLQWNMDMIDATPTGSYDVQPGRKQVKVGIIDTGIDGHHPDLAPNFSWPLSRNFTTDIPLIDGECEDDPDGSCNDPRNADEDGHGTHVAGIVGAAVNDLGVAGVAPNVTLVNLRAGQDSGYFFLQPSVDALTYAGDHGIDVVNMSYYIDPWLFNCVDNPADSPEDQMEQATIIEATFRALRYARKRGVTLVSATGNEWTDMGNPTFDPTSPDFPPGTEYDRDIDNSCLDLPLEGPKVIGVNALGPSGRNSWYSNFGTEQSDVSAPGGDSFDDARPDPQHRILSSYSLNGILQEEIGDPDDPKDDIDLIDDETGEPLTNRILRDCAEGTCGYYRYLQGTSMASPHATGVAALIVSQYGHDNGGDWTLKPLETRQRLKSTARDHSCPPGGFQTYPEVPPEFEVGPKECDGNREFNGLYGHGIVDALEAVGG
ncbi:MAG TPA: S8 family serine peptidase, partial [Actinomycetota bacterium]|nr:S8 family serine peptidase [Actinomycetota bacterium]